MHDASVDYLNNLLTVNIEQSIIGDEHELIRQLLQGNFSIQIRIDIMNGNDGVHHSTEFACKPVSHKVDYNYVVRSQVITHNLQFTYDSMLLLVVPVY